MGLFISLEGGEGSGKTVQADKLVQRLQEVGYNVYPIHEPGSTKLGQYLRDWLKSERPASHGAELFLFAAARSELVATVIKQNLSKPKTIIIADRYADSTTAYQGYGRGLRLEHVRVVNDLATQGIWPHLTILLDVEPQVGLARIGPVQQKLIDVGGPQGRLDYVNLRKFEEESPAFHRRVREGYLRLARAQPERWYVVDAAQPLDSVAAAIWDRVSRLLKDRSSQLEPALHWPAADTREQDARPGG